MTSTATERAHAQPPAPAGEGTSPGERALGAREQLRWFGTFWVMALAFHYTDGGPWNVLPVLALGLPLLVLPTAPWALAFTLAGSLVVSFKVLPTAANHVVLSILVGLGLLAAALWTLATRRRAGAGETFTERWLAAARTPVGLSLVVVYGFTVFDKLNSAFFDGVSSCAGFLLTQMIDLNGIDPPPLSPVLVQAAAVGTVIVETTIMVCLAVPRLRKWGLVIGMGFHCVLAPASFYDFASTVFALYLLLVPQRVFATLVPRAANIRLWALVAFGTHMMLSLTASATGTEASSFGLQWHTARVLTWYLAVLPFMVALVWAALRYRGRWPGWRMRPAVLLLVPLLAFVNGLAPYTGVKTVASYSMFSNLHTEGGQTNHLIPAVIAFQPVSYERDLVTVRKVDEPEWFNRRLAKWLREPEPVVVPFFELRRVALMWRDRGVADVRVEYQRNGVTRVVEDAGADPVLTAPMAWWQRELLAFRAVDSGYGRDRCRW